MQRRDHRRKFELAESRRALDAIAAAAQRTLGRKIARLPGGSFGLYVKCLVKDRRSGMTEAYRVVGSEHCATVLEAVADDMLLAEDERFRLRVLQMHESRPDEDFYLSMPANAEKRASKLRTLLREAWKLHARDTPWENAGQIFNAVKRGGAPPFPWWDDAAAGAAFESAALDDAATSARVYEYLAPRLYNDLLDQYEQARRDEMERLRREAPELSRPLIKLLAAG